MPTLLIGILTQKGRKKQNYGAFEVGRMCGGTSYVPATYDVASERKLTQESRKFTWLACFGLSRRKGGFSSASQPGTFLWLD
ncbi:MAG: hypothetical protein A3D24_02725 [Candidatus Blackburnbacteria bacterium RIFCSPHIGHO2_02_FULL_39_13]|uniref:Uncharacterized protein n=1 Tax=Candidatus Blackburnbacteria bacterium RIFCSPLOWO2_01_FULL_40_20 TaxID=1797519 RepID=A0A1G1VBJ4_9BACT|nr:MAG: hypothetical protein A3D24_02725 [Candidatus Blackburnbacteria bacterium RIFCSPHIGHO2_02_FULL_39_13]OGY12798.1 MAG: hypothetical protein A3A77_02890 [Candidatus Blackburnbacteria bacterium RIFCSPLOWO2_01_FULL_40_20]